MAASFAALECPPQPGIISMAMTADMLYPEGKVHATPFFGGNPVSPPSSPDRSIDAAHGVYGISVAADLVGSAPQNLRLYEARGLLTPARSAGGTRRYSGDDLARLRDICRLRADC